MRLLAGVTNLALLAALLVAGACSDDADEKSGIPGSGGSGGGEGAAGHGGKSSVCKPLVEDRDGDGVPGHYPPADCTPALEVQAVVDCDDADPSGQIWRYLDADGDGSGDERACLPSGDVPPGYGAIGGDCDDADPERSALAIEVPGDGIDQDCNGADLEPCSDTNARCPCSVDPECALETVKACDGFDLAVGAVAGCFDGDAINDFVYVANQGKRDFSGTIVLIQGNAQLVRMGSIAAGKATVGLALPSQFSVAEPLTVSTPDGGDCNPDNDVFPGSASVEDRCP